MTSCKLLGALLLVATIAAGCGSSHSAPHTTVPAAARSRTDATVPPQADRDAARRAVTAAVASLNAHSYRATATYSFTLNVPRAPAPLLSALRRLFPVRESDTEAVDGATRQITVTTPGGTQAYTITPSHVGVSGHPAGAGVAAEIRQQLSARATFLGALPGAGSWTTVAGPAARNLRAVPAASSLAPELLPLFATHPTAVHAARLAVEVYLRRDGALAGWRVALSCLVDLDAIAKHPGRAPYLVGVGLLGTTRVSTPA